MKKILLSIFFAMGAGSLFAQQDGHFTQFFRTKLNYNSAYAGSVNGKICGTFIGRSQWLGFGSTDKGQAPQTINGNIHGSIMDGRLGFGLNILNDQQGFEGTLIPTLSIAWHQPLSNGHIVSGGVGIGLIQKSLDGTKLKPQQMGDVLIPLDLVNGNTLDFNAGVYYRIPSMAGFRDIYGGLSATHINQGQVEYGVATKYNSKMHYYFMAGGVYDLGGSNFTLEPNIFVKNAVKTSVDVNVMTRINGIYAAGLTYRNVDAFAILAGWYPTGDEFDKFSLMASYDLTTSQLSQFSNGTVEISLRYCFNFKPEPPPKTIRPIYTPRFL